jgi:hypothetical protein
MGRKNQSENSDARETAPVIGPDPQPKVGDTVSYIWPQEKEGPLAGKTLEAKVTVVFEGHDGRLVNLDVTTGVGTVPVTKSPWRDEEDNAGNTWHWPE